MSQSLFKNPFVLITAAALVGGLTYVYSEQLGLSGKKKVPVAVDTAVEVPQEQVERSEEAFSSRPRSFVPTPFSPQFENRDTYSSARKKIGYSSPLDMMSSSVGAQNSVEPSEKRPVDLPELPEGADYGASSANLTQKENWVDPLADSYQPWADDEYMLAMNEGMGGPMGGPSDWLKNPEQASSSLSDYYNENNGYRRAQLDERDDFREERTNKNSAAAAPMMAPAAGVFKSAPAGGGFANPFASATPTATPAAAKENVTYTQNSNPVMGAAQPVAAPDIEQESEQLKKTFNLSVEFRPESELAKKKNNPALVAQLKELMKEMKKEARTLEALKKVVFTFFNGQDESTLYLNLAEPQTWKTLITQPVKEEKLKNLRDDLSKKLSASKESLDIQFIAGSLPQQILTLQTLLDLQKEEKTDLALVDQLILGKDMVWERDQESIILKLDVQKAEEEIKTFLIRE